MITSRLASLLAAFVCLTAQGQTCSGGVGGGTDATGNQCSAAGNDDNAAPPAAVVPHRIAAVATPMREAATSTAVRPTVVSAHVHQAAVGEHPADRHLVVAKQPAVSVHTAEIKSEQEALCSGGAGGGTDATGNQCNSDALTETMVVTHYVAR